MLFQVVQFKEENAYIIEIQNTEWNISLFLSFNCDDFS